MMRFTESGTGNSLALRPVRLRYAAGQQPTGVLSSGQHGQGGFRALVEVTSVRVQAVVARARQRVAHRHVAVVVALEPGPGARHLVPPTRITGDLPRPRTR